MEMVSNGVYRMSREEQVALVRAVEDRVERLRTLIPSPLLKRELEVLDEVYDVLDLT